MPDEEFVTHWEPECSEVFPNGAKCDWAMRLPILSDDQGGDYAMNLYFNHLAVVHPEVLRDE